jgi:hypothetical protein
VRRRLPGDGDPQRVRTRVDDVDGIAVAGLVVLARTWAGGLEAFRLDARLSEELRQ